MVFICLCLNLMTLGWERHPLGAGFAPRDIADSPTPDYDQGVGFRKTGFGGHAQMVLLNKYGGFQKKL